MDEWIELAKAFSDPGRVRALLALREGELCACRIIEILGVAPSTVSAHMTVLHRAGLVEVRKEGRWRHYRLSGKSASPLAGKMFAIAAKALSDDETVQDDARRLKGILSTAGCRGNSRMLA